MARPNLERLAQVRDEAVAELKRCLSLNKEDAEIADNVRAYWINRADGAE